MRIITSLVGALFLFVGAMAAQETPTPTTPGIAAPGQDRAGAPGRGGRGGRGRGGPPRQRNFVAGPEVGYTGMLGTLQWPTGPGNDETSTAGVATNSKGHIIVYHRPEAGKPPLLEFDQDGKFIKAFGQDLGITRAHGLRVDANDSIWITDVNIHQLMKLNPQGKVLMTLGTKGQAGKWNPAAATQLFNQPTDLGFDGSGNIYVANSHGGPDPRVDKFDKNGKFVTTWRVEPKEGDSANIHTIAVDRDGTVYAASREQQIIRVYDAQGKLLRTLNMPSLVCGLYFEKPGQLWMTAGQDGQIMKIDTNTGKPLGVFGKGPGLEANQFGEAHYMTISPKGEIYVSDTVHNRVAKFVKQ